MDMIGDQGPGITGGGGFGQDAFQTLDKIIPVIIVLKYLLALDSADNDVMQGIRSIYAGLSGHENSLSDPTIYVNFIILCTSPMLPQGYDYRRTDIGEYRIIYKTSGDTLQIILVGKRNDDEIYDSLTRQ